MAMFRQIMCRKYRKVLIASCVTVYLCATATTLLTNSIVKAVTENQYSEYLLKSLDGPIEYDEPSLIEYIANEILVPPSSLPYQLRKRTILHAIQDKPHSSEIFYKQYVRGIFNTTENGFFVEAGALDGESMSNTLWLEMHQGWTGLLVEPDPSNFKALISKHRKAWSANACLSIEKYPKAETLSSVDNIKQVKDRAMGSIIKKEDKIQGITSEHIYNSYYKSQCFPLGSLLLALNVTKIDLLSLDVEFVEEYILRNFDFKKFDVQVLFVEYYDFAKKEDFHKFLLSKGYEFIANKGADVIYCKNGTDLSARLSHIYPVRTFTAHVLRPP